MASEPVRLFLDLEVVLYHIITPLKINMEPKNEGLEVEFPFQTGDFQVPC